MSESFFSTGPDLSLALPHAYAVDNYSAAINTITTTARSAPESIFITFSSSSVSVLTSQMNNFASQGNFHSPNEPLVDLLHLELRRSQSEQPCHSNYELKLLSAQYESTEPCDLVVLISSMLMELIQINDKMPPHQDQQTRFHSRSPPQISVQSYLQRITKHAKLSPAILLTMVYYLDRLCVLYPGFTVSSLTIHRFLIVSATVASKGLSDIFLDQQDICSNRRHQHDGISNART